jgi:putative ABC transport system permease protein
MYPNLTPTLVVLLGAAAAVALYIAIRRPFLRKLALRQVSRRRTEAALVVAGSLLGTAIIVGSLIVGDTLNFSVKQSAYTNLGPVDEIVGSSTLFLGQQYANRLEPLRSDPLVDGLLTVHGDQAAITKGAGASLVAEPRASLWDVDFARAASFGGAGSGLSGPAPPLGEAVINADLARSLGATPGDTLTVYLYGQRQLAKVARVVPTRGLAGVGTGAVARNAFFAPGTLQAWGQKSGTEPQTFTFVSNAGGVEAGNRYTSQVTAKIHNLLGRLATMGAFVDTPKQRVLDQATVAGNSLGSLFLFIGSFAIIAGVMLLVVIFSMLAEERKSELGMLRAIGMKRSRLVRSFIIEGTLYALVASLIGIVVGLGVGRAVVIVAARIFNRMPAGEGGLSLAFHVTPVTIINGFAMGFLIAFVTVVLTSMRISRINIIAAIRDLPTRTGKRLRRRWLVITTLLSLAFALLAVPAIAGNQAVGTYLFPSIAVLLLCPLLARIAPARWVYTGAALTVLGWALLANAVRPGILDQATTAAYVILGVLLTFSAVFVVTQNQGIVTAPLRPIADRATPGGLAVRLGMAYPVSRRFRTGAILIMYSLVVFTLVLMTVLGAMISATVDSEVANASGGFAVRADFNPSSPIPDPGRTLTSGRLAGRIEAAVPLLVARTKVEHLASYSKPIDAVLIGADQGIDQAGLYPLTKRLRSFANDRAAWQAVLSDPRYVVVDAYLGQGGGGPPVTPFVPGDTLTLVDLSTGRTTQKTIAGILKSATGLYGIANSGFTPPVIEGQAAARAQFGDDAKLAAALVKLVPGESEAATISTLEAQFLGNGLSATSARQAVERSMAATRGFFQLMQGFLMLGLLVGVAGLGVMMVRAVRERRRSIGVLRALGFQARTVQRSFLTESSFVALEGILIGAALAIVTSYLLFSNYASFKGSGIGFPVPWRAIAVVVVSAALASMAITLWPARRASRIRPAVALRVE